MWFVYEEKWHGVWKSVFCFKAPNQVAAEQEARHYGMDGQCSWRVRKVHWLNSH
jgi:hypothetical protein